MRLFLGLCLAFAICMCPREARGQALTDDVRRQVVEAAATLIETRYVYPERGLRIAAQLRAEAGQFVEEDADAFAQALTERLRALSDDGHFAVEYRADETQPPTDQAYMEQQMQRWYGVGVNHGFEAVRRLDGGIGYLDLRVFAPTEMAGDMMVSAMTLLAEAPALIIDLRRNGGGFGEMVLMLEAYLFDTSVEVSGHYNRPEDRHTRSFTPGWVPGRRFGPDKPVYILISRRTFSAAEAFAYDMQALGRATIIGERSGGGAHPFAYRPLPAGFVLWLPESRSINPITGGDWQGTGVRPDVETAPDDALDEALRLATAAIAG